MAAGALAASGRTSIVEIFTVAVVATLCADLGWYGLGRWRGAGVLSLLGGLSPRASALVRRAQDGFLAHAGKFQLSARFLPELNPVAAGLAGATRVGVTRFIGYQAFERPPVGRPLDRARLYARRRDGGFRDALAGSG